MSHLKSVHLKCVCLKNVLSKIRPSKKRRGPLLAMLHNDIVTMGLLLSEGSNSFPGFSLLHLNLEEKYFTFPKRPIFLLGEVIPSCDVFTSYGASVIQCCCCCLQSQFFCYHL